MLRDVLKQMIALRGPISVATYMRQCLTHPEFGYYVKQDPFGAKGDFVTSPEISQMFGELVGVNLLTQWMAHGKPEQVRLVELGPGRGTLLSDLLRAAKAFPAFNNAIKQVQLVEASPALRELQRKNLEGYGKALDWLSLVKEVPRDHMPTFVVAHEFLDALPVHQLEKHELGWRERLVDFDGKADKFQLTLGAPNSVLARAIATQPRYKRLPTASEIEVGPEALDVGREVASILKHNTGAALFMDYGPRDTIPVKTFRGFKDHKQVDPFAEPGDADLTADVDFHALRVLFSAIPGLHTYGPASQRDWLHAMGIGARATVLANAAPDAAGKQRIADAYNRLTDKLHMGKTYKVLAVSTAAEPVLGFETPPPPPPPPAAEGNKPKI